MAVEFLNHWYTRVTSASQVPALAVNSEPTEAEPVIVGTGFKVKEPAATITAALFLVSGEDAYVPETAT